MPSLFNQLLIHASYYVIDKSHVLSLGLDSKSIFEGLILEMQQGMDEITDNDFNVQSSNM